MSNNNPYDFKKMKQLAAAIPLLSLVKQHSDTNISDLSARISHRQVIQKHTMMGGDVRASLLLLLSNAVGYNFFRHYINLLPEELRATDQTEQLQKQIEQLHQTIEQEKLQTAHWRERAERAESWVTQAMKGNS